MPHDLLSLAGIVAAAESGTGLTASVRAKVLLVMAILAAPVLPLA